MFGCSHADTYGDVRCRALQQAGFGIEAMDVMKNGHFLMYSGRKGLRVFDHRTQRLSDRFDVSVGDSLIASDDDRHAYTTGDDKFVSITLPYEYDDPLTLRPVTDDDDD